MKKSMCILTFILLALTNCSNDSKSFTDMTSAENQKQINSENIFENYLKTLEQIPLPFSHNPFEQLPALSKNYNKTVFEKYKHVWTTQPLGILFNDSKTVTLIDFAIGDLGLVPFLTTYDRQGIKIDSLGPYKKTGEDMGYKAIEYLTIFKDKTISVSDSVTIYTLKPDSSDIDKTSIKLTIGLTKYTIEADGHFRKQK
ncbi:MAG: hypothetical protein IPO27_18900 [Bacteroidetes bacterium]|nr:hypothetical protein [Bacteroidota bacterium]